MGKVIFLSALGVVGLLVVIVYFVQRKNMFFKARSKAVKIEARVVKYKWHKKRMGSTTTVLNYPYVKIKGRKHPIKIDYVYRIGKPFKINQIIPVFWYDRELVYWHKWDKGLKGAIPNRSNKKTP